MKAPSATATLSKDSPLQAAPPAQLRDAGISADTLQGYLRTGRPRSKSQATRQTAISTCSTSLHFRAPSRCASSSKRSARRTACLLIGDTRQHQGVEAGKPFEQLQQAGMRTAQLDQIMRQKDPELLRAVEHLAKNETKTGIDLLQQQGRVTELADPQQRIEAIAKNYADQSE